MHIYMKRENSTSKQHTFDLSHNLEERFVDVLSEFRGRLKHWNGKCVPQIRDIGRAHITLGHITLYSWSHVVEDGMRLVCDGRGCAVEWFEELFDDV